MDEDAGIVFMILFWASFAIVVFQRLWTIRRLRNKVEKLTNEAIARAAPPSPVTPVAVETDELRRIQQRLQVLERIAVERENTLSREIEDLRAAG
jgi:hypothetical protein